MQQIVIWVPSDLHVQHATLGPATVTVNLLSEREGNKFTIQLLRKLTNEAHAVIPSLREEQTRIESPYPLKSGHLL